MGIYPRLTSDCIMVVIDCWTSLLLKKKKKEIWLYRLITDSELMLIFLKQEEAYSSTVAIRWTQEVPLMLPRGDTEKNCNNSVQWREGKPWENKNQHKINKEDAVRTGWGCKFCTNAVRAHFSSWPHPPLLTSYGRMSTSPKMEI